jgi:hypothetical protein
MRRVIVMVVALLLTGSTALGIKVTLFSDTPRFAKIMKDVVIATCDRAHPETHYGDGLHPVEVTVQRVLKGTSAVGAMKIATIYAMEPGKRYLLASLGGSVGGITFLAVPELSVVEIPEGFDLSKLEGRTLEEQLQLIFAARQAAVEQEEQALQAEEALLEKAMQK